MNVLCVAALVSKKLCDDAYMYIEVQRKGAKLAVISSGPSGMRGRWKLAKYVNMDGVDVYGLYSNHKEMIFFPTKELKKCIEIAKSLKPDILFCSQELNMRLALLLQKYLKIPILLRVEDGGAIFRGYYYRGWKDKLLLCLLGLPPSGPKLWAWLCEKADALITHNPRDKDFLNVLSLHRKPVFFLPWPAKIPEGFQLQKRNKETGIYVGSLHPIKESHKLEKVIPKILKETPTKKFIVIGTGPLAPSIKRLKQRLNDALEYYPQLPRLEVLKLISSSYYGYTPTPAYSYGFLGDSWGVGTPVLLNHNVVGSKDLELAVARNENDLIRLINRLYEDPKFYQMIQNAGYVEFNKRSPQAVADELYQIFEKTIDLS